MAIKPVCFDESEPPIDPEIDYSANSILPDFLMPDLRLSSREKCFVAELCGLAQGRPRLWPTDPGIRAAYNGTYSDKWIKKTLAKLAELRWVEVEYRPSESPSRIITLPFFAPGWVPDKGMEPAIKILRGDGTGRGG